MSFDPELALADWLTTGKLSRRKLAALDESHIRSLDVIPMASSVDIAPSEFCEAAQLPCGSYWPVVVAAALDFANPINLVGSHLGAPTRTIEVLDQLVRYGFLEEEDADACLNAMGHGN